MLRAMTAVSAMAFWGVLLLALLGLVTVFLGTSAAFWIGVTFVVLVIAVVRAKTENLMLEALDQWELQRQEDEYQGRQRSLIAQRIDITILQGGTETTVRASLEEDSAGWREGDRPLRRRRSRNRRRKTENRVKSQGATRGSLKTTLPSSQDQRPLTDSGSSVRGISTDSSQDIPST